MFFKKKRNYFEEFKKAHLDQDLNSAPVILKDMFNSFKDEKNVNMQLLYTCGYICENKLYGFGPFLGMISQHYSESLMPFSVFYADFLMAQSKFDLAAAHSRKFLRQLKDAGLLNKLNEDIQNGLGPFLQDALGRAVLLVSSVYTEKGARSYSREIINYFLDKSQLNDSSKSILENELKILESELAQTKFKNQDSLWSDFFTTFLLSYNNKLSSFETLFSSVDFETTPLLKRRLELIEGAYRFNSPIGSYEEEFFLLVVQNEDGTSLLS